jgi:hypothetical protein
MPTHTSATHPVVLATHIFPLHDKGTTSLIPRHALGSIQHTAPDLSLAFSIQIQRFRVYGISAGCFGSGEMMFEFGRKEEEENENPELQRNQLAG